MKNLQAIQPDQLVQIYSGKPGCACGCRGRYVEGVKGKRILANMVKFAEHISPDSFMTGHDLDGNPYISVESENKVYTVYFKGETK